MDRDSNGYAAEIALEKERDNYCPHCGQNPCEPDCQKWDDDNGQTDEAEP